MKMQKKTRYFLFSQKSEFRQSFVRFFEYVLNKNCEGFDIIDIEATNKLLDKKSIVFFEISPDLPYPFVNYIKWAEGHPAHPLELWIGHLSRTSAFKVSIISLLSWDELEDYKITERIFCSHKYQFVKLPDNQKLLKEVLNA